MTPQITDETLFQISQRFTTAWPLSLKEKIHGQKCLCKGETRGKVVSPAGWGLSGAWGGGGGERKNKLECLVNVEGHRRRLNVPCRICLGAPSLFICVINPQATTKKLATGPRSPFYLSYAFTTWLTCIDIYIFFLKKNVVFYYVIYCRESTGSFISHKFWSASILNFIPPPPPSHRPQ